MSEWVEQANKRMPACINDLPGNMAIMYRWNFLKGVKELACQRHYLYYHEMTEHDWTLVSGYANNAVLNKIAPNSL